jgi:anti-sigma regulatory factor (Ser/Thr protein kinase)
MGQRSAWSHETVLAAEPISASRARAFVCFHLAEHHLQHLIDDVRLVVSELVTNTLSQGDTPLIVTLHTEQRLVRLAVQDGSFSVPAQPAAHVVDTSGRGLSIVDRVSSNWGVTLAPDGTKSMWACFPDAYSKETLS